MNGSATDPRSSALSVLAVRFFLTAAALFLLAGLLASLLIQLSTYTPRVGVVDFPPAFWMSTGLLLLGSGILHRSLHCVRRERQQPFRRNLLFALGVGTLFVAVQSYGLWCLLQNQVPAKAETGVNAFLFVLASLHGLHFTIALSFVVFVAVQGLADRYDHEYYWGVIVCTYFWHALGVAWAGILIVFAIAT